MRFFASDKAFRSALVIWLELLVDLNAQSIGVRDSGDDDGPGGGCVVPGRLERRLAILSLVMKRRNIN